MNKDTRVPFVTYINGPKHITIVSSADPADRRRLSKRDTAGIRQLCARRKWSLQRLTDRTVRGWLAKYEAQKAATA